MGWQELTLGEVAELIQGGRRKLSGSHFVSEGGFPAFGAGGHNGNLPSYEFDRPGLVLATVGTCGRVYRATGKWSSLANTRIIFPDPHRCDIDFLWYQINDPRRWPLSGTSQKFIKPSDVLRHRVRLPPLAEQRRIGEVLDRADALRVKRRTALAQLDTLTQSIFLDMFGDPVRFQSGQLPSVRDAISQGALLEIQDGNHGERHPKVEDFSEAGIPFITANCLKDGRLNLESCYLLPPSWLKRLRIGFAQAGDVLLSHKGSIGLTAIVPTREEPVILSPQVTYYRSNRESLLPQFLRGFFQTDSFQAKMKKESEQTTRSYLGITRQLDLPLVVPPIEQQREFARRVEAVERLKAEQRASLSELGALFASLQHRAFRGEL